MLVATVLETVAAMKAALAVLTGLELTAYLFPPPATVTDGSTYDFVIAGGGSAGSVVANRLTELANVNVLMIDMGGDPPIESVLPGLFPLLPNSAADHKLVAENDNYTSQNVKTGAAQLTQGKMLGGSTSLNHLSYTRGNRFDYDNWVLATNDESYRYDNFIEYFMKSEQLLDEEVQSSPTGTYYGYDGYMKLSRQPSADNDAIFAAFAEVGLEKVLDSNDPFFSLGVTEPMLNLADGRRQSGAQAYLNPIIDRTNLHVLKNTQVTKVLFDDNNNAIGVEALTSDGTTLTIYASREVIVSAGALLSPKLLMLSGIGPSDHLTNFDIPVISDLPVGQNLFDHTPAVVIHKLQEAAPNTAPANPHLFPAPATIAYAALNNTQLYPDYQSINLIFPADNVALIQICSLVFSYDDPICQDFFDSVAGRVSFLSLVNILRPVSRGEVLLRSADAQDPPIVNLGTYSNEEDLNNMAHYLQDFARITETSAFQSVNAEIVDLDLADCNDIKRNTLEYWRCYALNLSTTMWSYSSTCALGSVLDNKFGVIGVQKLRVVDASAMPDTIRGNINAAVVALAEKASDVIKQDYSASPRL